MDEEDKRIIESFEANFSQYKMKNIALYGIQQKSRYILENYPDYNVIAMFDGVYTSGDVCGRKIYPIEQIAHLNIDIIIIASKMENVEIIYRRINNLCFKEKIMMYDAYGRNLYELFHKEELRYYQIDKAELIKQIDQHDVITFDIFDTLIMRKVLYPSDVFDLMDDRLRDMEFTLPDFKEIRQKADLSIAYTNPDVYAIYDNLQKMLNISDDQINNILALEIEMEKEVLIRRDIMADILEYAIQSGKKVCLVSDMYLPASIVIPILTDLGIVGYHSIYVSCDYHKPKMAGLYEYVKKDYPATSYLHIGDSMETDGGLKDYADIDVFLIKSARDILLASSYGELLFCANSINERTILGLAVSELFNDPFALSHTEGKPVFNNVYSFGYFFAGTLLSVFTMWLIDMCKKNKFDKILFSARDGFLIQRLYNKAADVLKLSNMPKSVYFQTSRILCAKSGITTDEDICWVVGPAFDGTPESMLKDRFELNDEDIVAYKPEQHKSIFEYALLHKELIIKKSREIRKHYLKYIDNLGIKREDRCALFDFVSCGSCQYFLEKIVPFKITGVYVGRYNSGEEEKNKLKIYAMYRNGYLNCKESNFIQKYLFFETILTSFSASINGINENGDFCYNEETRSEEEFKFIREMHKAIENYFSQYLGLYAKHNPISGTELIDKMLGYISPYYTDNQCEIIRNLCLVDDFGHGKIELNLV